MDYRDCSHCQQQTLQPADRALLHLDESGGREARGGLKWRQTPNIAPTTSESTSKARACKNEIRVEAIIPFYSRMAIMSHLGKKAGCGKCSSRLMERRAKYAVKLATLQASASA